MLGWDSADSFFPMSREVQIYCPKCQWEPLPSSRWCCTGSCGCVWNTFDTGGVCPECGRAWEETQCLSCHQRSAHSDWYHHFGDDPVAEVVKIEEPDVVKVD